MELFTFISSYLLLISMFYQNQNIYRNFTSKEFILNIDVIEYQLNELSKNFNNKYRFWSFSFTVISISLILLCFNIGNEYKYVFIGLGFFLYIQYRMEYYNFYLPLLIKMETENIPARVALENLAIEETKEEMELNDFQKNIKEIKTDEEISSFIIGKESKKISLSQKDNKARTYIDTTLYELDLKEKKLFKITQNNTKYMNSLYERITLNKIYLYDMIEPAFLSLLLCAIITI